MSNFDKRAFRDALGSYATGVAVITVRGRDGALAGITINSFASVSLDPPLVLWSLSLDSPSLPPMRNCGHYAINVLAQDQQALSERFAGTRADRFAGVEFTPGAGDAPLLSGCCAWFECHNVAHHPGGDHLIFVGQVDGFARFDRPPLVFQGSEYHRLGRPLTEQITGQLGDQR